LLARCIFDGFDVDEVGVVVVEDEVVFITGDGRSREASGGVGIHFPGDLDACGSELAGGNMEKVHFFFVDEIWIGD